MDTANGINYVTSAAYQADGQMTGFVSGNGAAFAGITSAFSYNKRLQPVNMSANAPSQTVFSIGYDFQAGNGTAGTGSDNGNVWNIYNYRDRTRDQSFNYDTLNRLISAQNAGTDCTVSTVNGKSEYWGNTYGYDPWGNLIDKTIAKCGAENFHPGAASVQNQLTGYGYDAAGNMISDPTDSVSSTYDAENRIATASTPLGVFTYTYDADGNRVEKSGGGTGTLYWYMTPGIIGESDLSGVMKSEYVFFNGDRVARRDFDPTTETPTGVFYYFSDHLKTASIVTDPVGNIKSESDYYPWGGELQFVNNDSNHYKFTGKERDTESGLDYFGARYYSNGLGRFITPDWAAKAVDVPYAEFSDPQSLNLYSYVRNIPTVKVDVDGHDGVAAEILSFLSDGLGMSGPAWAAGSVALPGVLGGGLGYFAINTAAQNNNIRASAQMGEVVANNKLIMAQQAALSQDAQAGALIKAGKDANEAATATIDAAIKGIAGGKYKDAADVQSHIDKLREGMKEVARKTEAVKTAVGKKARDAAKKALEKATKDVRGHEKDLRQKPQIKPKEEK